MTSADFAARYKLLKRLTESGVRSYNAQQSSTGRPVMVHFLDGGATGDSQARLLLVRRLDAVDRSKVVETIEVDETSVIVTQFLPAFETLDAWLDARALDRRASTPLPAVQQPAAPDPNPGRSAMPLDLDAPTMKMRTVPLPPPAEEKAPVPDPEMGEFTRMFRATPAASNQAIPAPVPPAAPVRPVSPPPVAAPIPHAVPVRPPPIAAPIPPSAPVRPMSQPLAAPMRPGAAASMPPIAPTPPEPPRAKPPAAPAPGEFTGVFRSLGGGSTPASSPAFGGSSPMFGQSSANPPAPASPTPSGRGSSPSFGHDSPPLFAQPPAPQNRGPGHAPPPEPAAGRIFELALPPVTPAREPASDRIVPMSGYAAPPESATGMMAARQAPQPPPPSRFPQAAPIAAPLAAPSAPIANAPSQAQGPSEFTRVMKGMATPVAAASVGVVAAAMHQDAAKKAAAAKPSMVPLIVALNAVFFAAIALILYVVFKR